jgi:UDP-hydrolysing UDP-N-acetyl-D-glucosamine 2-epimerase
MIGVVTTGRSDYGLLRPVIRALLEESGVRVRIYATGMHFSRRLGYTIREVGKDWGAKRVVRLPILLPGDDPASIAGSIARATSRFADEFKRRRPDILVLLGDRFETFGVATSTLPFNIPLAHIHGGEITEGAVDDVMRHAISKMSHLHFVAAAPYGLRLRQMGEEAWRVTVAGAPALDALSGFTPTPSHVLERRLGMPINRRTLLVTYHPETRRAGETQADVEALLDALQAVGLPVVLTAPNVDTLHKTIARRMGRFAAAAPGRAFVANLGQQDYFSAMHYSGAMVGNSSSGIIEAPSFRLPVVNVGDRQRGRIRARNVIDVPAGSRSAIERAIVTVMKDSFRRSLDGLTNPYGRKKAGRIIARRLAAVPINRRLLMKPFADLQMPRG